MRKRLRKFVFNTRLRFAIKKANRLKKETKHKFIVLIVKNRPRIYSKAVLKEFIKKGFFQKGTTIQKLESMALYITK